MIKHVKKPKAQKTSLVDRGTTGLDITQETILDLPYITLIGNKEIQIENFISILAYEEQLISLKTQCGILTIEGKELLARNMDSESIRIKGMIENIGFTKER